MLIRCTFAGLLLLASVFAIAKPDSFTQNYIELEVTDYPLEVITSESDVQIKGYACYKKFKGSKGGCEKFAPHDLALFDFEFTYPDATHDLTNLVQLIEKTDRFEFQVTLPRLPEGHDSAQFSARIVQKGKSKRGLYVAIDKMRAHITRLEQLKDKLDPKGLTQYQKVRSQLQSIEAKLLAKIRSLDSRFAERSIPLQVQNFVANDSSWMISTDTWEITTSFPLGIGFKGETTWADIFFQSYRAEGDEWKVQVYAGANLLKEETFQALNLSQRVLIPTSAVGNNPIRVKVSGRNTSKSKPTFEEFISREINIPRLADTVTPNYVSLLPPPGRYVGREIPEFSLTMQDTRGRMDRSTVDGVLIEDSGLRVSLKDYLNFETSQSTLVDFIHGNQNGSDFFRFFGSPIGIPEGFYSLQILTQDFAGNKGPISDWRFIVDRTPPQFVIPAAASIKTNNLSFDLGFKVIDKTAVDVKLFHNGNLIAETTETDDGVEIELVAGPNIVKISATDEAGNYAEAFYPPIFYDNIAPEIAEINLRDGQLVRDGTFTIQGRANEGLQAILINGQEVDITAGSLDFSYDFTFLVEGPQKIEIQIVDEAGNFTFNEINFNFLLKIIDGNLIMVENIGEGKNKIIGFPGATRANFPVSAKDGFFNTGSTTAAEDGSFEIILDQFGEAVVTATSLLNGRQESALAKFKYDTTFAGIVKDIYDNPLPNVTITILNSQQSTTTDASGRFYLPDPALGDQVVIFDGRSVHPEVLNGEKEFSLVAVNISFGYREQNILDRPVYLAPKMLDGTETIMSSGSGVTVSSPHAPGFSLNIPSGVTRFPNGTNTGAINVMEIPGDKTVIELPSEVRPSTVYALEPSGLKFSERVPLTLPNTNEFPVGTELVIVSKNSESGFWEIDGSASVTGPGVIETKPGEGISHFSEIFASPLGMEMKSFANGDKPNIDVMEGSVTTSISLPSFKVLGEDISPNLSYNSSWAYPNVVVSNVFDLPRKYYSFNIPGTVNAKGVLFSESTFQTWVTPEYIDSWFAAGNLNSKKTRFTGLPDRALVSTQHNLSSLDSGIVPSITEYEIGFKNLTLITTKAQVKTLTGSTTVKLEPETRVDWQSVFPPPLVSPLYLQNKTDSSYGRGWKLGLTKQILNPLSDRVIVESESGQIGVYAVDNRIETLAESETDIQAMDVRGEDVFYANKDDKLVKILPESEVDVATFPKYEGYLGVNNSWYYTYTRRCTRSGWRGCRSYEYTYIFTCDKYQAPFSTSKNIKSLSMSDSGGVYLDGLGGVFSVNNHAPLAGQISAPPIFKSATNASGPASIQNFCTENLGGACSTDRANASTYRVSQINYSINYETLCNVGSCYNGPCEPRTFKESAGSIPQIGFADGPKELARFNNPFEIVKGNRENTYIVSDFGNNSLRFVDIEVGNVSTIAGNMATTDLGNGNLATQASIYHPRGLAVDSDGSIYVSSERGYIRKITPDQRIYALAGKPTTQGGVLSDVTSFSDLALNNPGGMAIDRERRLLFVADTGHNRILKLDLETNTAQVVAGNGTCVPGELQSGKVGLAVSICQPERIALDTNGNLLILDKANKRIHRLQFAAPTNGQIFYKGLAEDNTTLSRRANGSFELSYRDGSKTYFNSQGLQTSTEDRVGRVNTFTHDQSGRLTRVQLPTGQAIEMDYSGDLLNSITDPAGRMTRFYYNGNLLTEVSFPDGTEKRFNYQENGILIREEDQKGGLTQYNLNNFKRLAQVVRPDGTSINLQEAKVQTIANGSDENNPKPLVSLENLEDSISDAKGATTSFKKDINGYVSKITDSENKVTTIIRDIEGRPTRIDRFDGTYAEFTYNQETGDLISKFDSASNTSESYQYDLYGNLLSYTNPLGQTRSAVYDSVTGLLVQAKDYLGNTTTRTYKPLGLLESVTSPSGEVSQMVYDDFGNVNQMIAPTGEITVLQRDYAGNVISRVNPKNETTQYQYDMFNRITQVTTARNLTTSYQYSTMGELLKITDPIGNQTTFQYDALARVTKKISPLSQVWEMAYDQNGNLINEVDPIGNQKSFTYDAQDRLISKVLPDNTYNFAYSTRGNMISASNNESALSMSYINVAGKDQVDTITSSGANLPTFSVTNNYDILGRRVGIQTSMGTWSSVLDPNGRMTSLSGPGSMNYSMSYDVSGRLLSLTRPGSVTNLSFDGSSFVTSMMHKKGEAILSGFNYGRDAVGNKTHIESALGSSQFSYDEEGQLTNAILPELTELFQYDQLGNRVQDNYGGFSYDEKKYRLLEDYKYLYAFDANGNMISKQEKGLSGLVHNYSYTSENQLKHVTIYEGTTLLKEVHFTYDVLGRRVKKQFMDTQNPSKSFEHRYVFDGDEMLGIYDVDNNLLARYTQSGMRTDDTLGLEITAAGASAGLAAYPGQFHFLKDSLGTITDITDHLGNVIQRYSYSSFGKILEVIDGSGNETTNPIIKPHYTFTNRELDEEIGLYYYRARYYDAHIGRFLQEDPHPGKGTDVRTVFQKYTYANNNPISYIDPNGEFIFLAIFAFAAGGTAYFSVGAVATAAILGFTGTLAAFEAKNNFNTRQTWEKDGWTALGVATAVAAAAAGGAWLGMKMGQSVATMLKLKGGWAAALEGALASGIASGLASSTNDMLTGNHKTAGESGLTALGIGVATGGLTGWASFIFKKPVYVPLVLASEGAVFVKFNLPEDEVNK